MLEGCETDSINLISLFLILYFYVYSSFLLLIFSFKRALSNSLLFSCSYLLLMSFNFLPKFKTGLSTFSN
jgi:hypothetical protein